MAFTYDLNTAIGQVRFEVGDKTEPALLTDEEIAYALARRNDAVLATAADICDALSTKFATDYNFEWQSGTNARGKFDRAKVSEQFAARAVRLLERAREEVSGGLTAIPVTRIDGTSDDLSTRDGSQHRADTFDTDRC
jgi:hypothetical protein